MLIIKGFFIGIGKIIPGVSGSLIAISLGVYEKAIEAIVTMKKNFKDNIFYLGQLALGLLISIIGFSNLIVFCLDRYYRYTMFLFIGLMMGNIPSSIKEIKKNTKKNYLYFFISILLVIFIYQFQFEKTFFPEKNLLDFLFVFLIGMLDAVTMIIPGVSGTALFMMLNCYSFVMKLFSNIHQLYLFAFIFGLGSFTGIILTSILVHYLFKKYHETMQMVILGFTVTSFFTLLKPLVLHMQIYEIPLSFLLWILGFFLSSKLEKLS